MSVTARLCREWKGPSPVLSLSLSMVIDSRRCILGIGWVGGVTGSTVDVVRGRRRERAGVEGNEKEEVEKVPPSDPLSSQLQASCRAFESVLEEVNESERVGWVLVERNEG